MAAIHSSLVFSDYMKNLFYLFAACLVMLTAACDEDKNEISDVGFVITPRASDSIRINAGERQRYEIDLYTTHDYIKHILISSYNSIEGHQVLTDTTLSTYQEKFIFDYLAPHLNRNYVNVSLTFEMWDNADSYGRATRQLIVQSATILLEEKSGIVLRSAASGFADAFSFAAPSQTFSWLHSPDSVRADIYLVADSTFSNLSFASNTKGKMVRINSFDYAAATALGVQNVYSSSLRDDRIENLKTNDIILVGHDSRAEGVLRINNIIRNGDSSERSVQLSFKGIENAVIER